MRPLPSSSLPGPPQAAPARGSLAAALLLLLTLAPLAGCQGEPDDTPWCSLGEPAAVSVAPDAPVPTWHGTVAPIVRAKCVGCHQQGDISPFTLESYEDFFAVRFAARAAVMSRHMPPWQAARCCTDYFEDRSLTDAELDAVVRFVEGGAPLGDPEQAAPLPEVREPLSRVDVRLEMPQAYVPRPPRGSTDDNRCFVLEWPLAEPVYITGLNPRPGNRALVHHLIVAALDEDSAEQALKLQDEDDLPGFDCNGGLGEFRGAQPLGGSLIGGDFPRGLGTRVEPGAKLLLNIHYSTARLFDVSEDRTSVDFKVEPEAREAKTIPLANPAWLVRGAMQIPAGEKDAVFFYRFKPHLLTNQKRVKLQGVTPHMHTFATRITVRVLRAAGGTDCLLEIPDWEFGWEQPFWFEREQVLEPEDALYLECHFDNSAENQPPGQEPRDISWGGNNQDMCAAFVSFTEE
jgi:hypothetical protein